MAVIDQVITDRYAIYNADCMDMLQAIPDESIHLSVYSPPFGGLYHYSSDDRDMSNARNYDEFFEHYGYVIDELARVTMPGRVTAVHCMDVPTGNTGKDAMIDFPGDIIRAHEKRGWEYVARYAIWKEPLGVRNRTMVKNLAHKTVVDDASRCSNAAADYLVVFRRKGDNPVPIANPTGFLEYAGEDQPPADLLRFRGMEGDQKLNRYSHHVWRRYASAFWDDIRLSRVLPFKPGKEVDDEKHVHPLQLDVIHRVVQLWSNEGEKVLTPFLGVGSEVYEAVRLGRFGVGAELKASYFRQAVRNLEVVDVPEAEQEGLFDGVEA